MDNIEHFVSLNFSFQSALHKDSASRSDSSLEEDTVMRGANWPKTFGVISKQESFGVFH